jgi:hypothetical protein
MYTSGKVDRVSSEVNIIALDFHLGDTIGRDLFIHLDEYQRSAARKLILRLLNLTDASITSEKIVNPVERATETMYDKMRENSPLPWLKEFTDLYNIHLDITQKDNTVLTCSRVPTLQKYLDDRVHVVGLFYFAALLEYCNGNFFNWITMEKEQLAASVKLIQLDSISRNFQTLYAPPGYGSQLLHGINDSLLFGKKHD